jgi:hypothetical protein
MLQQLLITYTTRTQHASTAKNNYSKFNANAAYVKHTIALQLLQQYYAQYAVIRNCSNAYAMLHKLNASIVCCNSKLRYAQTHKNFCVNTATRMLAAHNLQQRNAAIAAQRAAQ